MSDDATFSFHINSVASKAKHMCAWILRTFNNKRNTGGCFRVFHKQLFF